MSESARTARTGRFVTDPATTDPWDLVAQALGKRVAELRVRRGLTQAALCRRIAQLGPEFAKVARPNLSHLERGISVRGIPSLRTLVSVSRGLGVPVGALLIGVDDHLK